MPDEDKPIRKPMTQMDRLELLLMVNVDALTRLMAMISLYSPAMRKTVDDIQRTMLDIVKQIHGDFEEDNSDPANLPSHDVMLKDLMSDPTWRETLKRSNLLPPTDEEKN